MSGSSEHDPFSADRETVRELPDAELYRLVSDLQARLAEATGQRSVHALHRVADADRFASDEVRRLAQAWRLHHEELSRRRNRRDVWKLGRAYRAMNREGPLPDWAVRFWINRY